MNKWMWPLKIALLTFIYNYIYNIIVCYIIKYAYKYLHICLYIYIIKHTFLLHPHINFSPRYVCEKNHLTTKWLFIEV